MTDKNPKSKEDRGSTKNESIERYLDTKYKFRYNVIKCKPEFRLQGEEKWKPVDKYELNSLKREIDSAIGICSSVGNLKN